MNKYVLCVEKTSASVVLQSLLAIITIYFKNYLNTVLSIVIAKSTTFEVNVPQNIALSHTVKFNCNN